MSRSVYGFAVGDRVRFHPDAMHFINYRVSYDEIGEVVAVESEHVISGEGQKIQVQFECCRTEWEYPFRFLKAS